MGHARYTRLSCSFVSVMRLTTRCVFTNLQDPVMLADGKGKDE
jgi:hypothetical protein